MKARLAVLGRALALLWAGFWIFFFAAESWASHTPVLIALLWVGVGLLFLLLALLPWRWERTGGFLLVAVGFSAGVAYSIWSPPGLSVASRLLTVIAFSGPPLAAGILFLTHRRAVAVGD